MPGDEAITDLQAKEAIPTLWSDKQQYYGHSAIGLVCRDCIVYRLCGSIRYSSFSLSADL